MPSVGSSLIRLLIAGRLGTVGVLVALCCGIGGAARAQIGTIALENWGFYQENLNGSARWQYQPRLLVPFALGSGWTFTQQVDVPFYYTDEAGPANPAGAWRFRLSDVFIEEILDAPAAARNFNVRTSVRLQAPTGDASPFGSDQWQVAPGVGFNWQMPDLWNGVTLAPYVRYFFGFDPKSADITTVRTLDLYPTLTFGLTEDWAMALYPRQAVTYDARKHSWFVPLEAMLVTRAGKSLTYGFGGAYAVVTDDPLYRWLIEARLTYSF